MAVYGYARVSTNRQVSGGEGLDVQRRQIEEWCMVQGEELAVPPFQDEGVSGSIPVADRPAGRRLLAALKPGDIIVAAKLDRLFRSALDALRTIERLKAGNVKVWLIDLGEVTDNGMAKAFLTVASAFAELERNMIQDRVMGPKSDQRKRGGYRGGKLPFGFKEGPRGSLEPVPAEQAMMTEIRELRVKGLPLRSIRERIEKRHGRRLGLATLAKVGSSGSVIVEAGSGGESSTCL